MLGAIALGQAAKPNPSPARSDMGLVTQPDPVAWHRTHKKQRSRQYFLTKQEQRQRLHDATVSSIMRTLYVYITVHNTISLCS
jgi:hypothetical protein